MLFNCFFLLCIKCDKSVFCSQLVKTWSRVLATNNHYKLTSTDISVAGFIVHVFQTIHIAGLNIDFMKI